ncbi:MAG: hypothetical protein WA184_07165, partial [Stellaceae bacterium]
AAYDLVAPALLLGIDGGKLARKHGYSSTVVRKQRLQSLPGRREILSRVGEADPRAVSMLRFAASATAM